MRCIGFSLFLVRGGYVFVRVLFMKMMLWIGFVLMLLFFLVFFV